MRRSAAITIAVAISGLLLVLLAGAAMAAARPGTASAPAQAGALAPAPGVQLTVSEVDDLVRQREAVYRAQLDELTRRIQVGQEHVAALRSQEQALADRLAQLEQARQDRAASYQGQLGTLQAQYNPRFDQYAAQLQEIQSRLAEAKALLGQ